MTMGTSMYGFNPYAMQMTNTGLNDDFMSNATGFNNQYAQLAQQQALLGAYQQPTADVVEVVHGEWIKADSMPRSAKCSECNCWITRHTITENWFRYCPHCGAKMDGKKVE